MKQKVQKTIESLYIFWSKESTRMYFVFLMIFAAVCIANVREVNSLNRKIDDLIVSIDTLERSNKEFSEQMHTKLSAAHEEIRGLKGDIEELNEAVGDIASSSYSERDIDLIALVTMAEADGEPELGKRLVIDTILNRVEHPSFPSTAYEVVYSPNQFTSMTNGRVDQCYVKESIRTLVIDEIDRRTDSQVLYFRTGRYHENAKDLYKIGNHYFSGYKT